MQCYNGWFAEIESRYNHLTFNGIGNSLWTSFYMLYVFFSFRVEMWYTIFYGLISFVHNSFTTVYSTTCMYAMRKFALCECYCLFFYSLQVCCRPSYVSVFLVYVIYFSCRCVVVVLCEYVCKYMLFISLCRCVVVFLCEYVCKYLLFISLCRCVVVL